MVSFVGKEIGANVGEIAEAALKGTQTGKVAVDTAAQIGKKALAETGKDILSINMINAAKKKGISLEKIQAFLAKRTAAQKYDSCVQNAYRNLVKHNSTYQVGTAFAKYMKDGETLKEGVKLIERAKLPATVTPADMKNLTNMPIKETATGALGWIKGKGDAVINAAKKHPVAAVAIALAAVGLGYLAFKKPAEQTTLKEAA